MQHHHPFVRPLACLVAAAAALLSPACSALGQNLYTNPGGEPRSPAPPDDEPRPAAMAPATAAPGAGGGGAAAPSSSPPNTPAPATGGPAGRDGQPVSTAVQLTGFSLFAVAAPPPRRYAKHDLVEVIINESSVQQFNQTYDNKKDYDVSAELSKFPSFKALFEDLALREGIGASKPGLGVKSNNKYKGEGKFSRNDKVQAKITATVLEVKPNGNLVLEARESIQSDRETSTMVLAGACRAEDITKQNTIQSSQLAGLTIKIEHEGDVKSTAEKGLIPRVLEAVFNF